MKNSAYIAVGVGSIFLFILGGIFLLHIPICVRHWLSTITTILCFIIFAIGLYIIPKFTLKLKKKEERILLTSAIVFSLANFIFMYMTYALGFESKYPYLYGLGFNLITMIMVLILMAFCFIKHE